MTLYKRGNIWWSYVTVDGVRHGKSAQTRNRRLAEQVDDKFKEELTVRRTLAPQFNPELTFAELAAQFLAHAGTKTWHVERLKALLPFFGEYSIGKITKNHAREYRQWRHAQKTISDTTVNRDLECVRHIFFWAVEEGLLPTNPLARPPMVRERRRRRPVMSLEEESALLNACSPHLKKIVIMALDTGMRRGEILNQRWEDVDFSRQLLFVSHSKTAEGEAREIPLTQRLFALLWENRENDGLIFTFDKHQIGSIKTAWRGTLRRANIRHYRFHDLRHTFNTRLMEAGVMQEVRKALMGHSSGEDVHAIYTHVELPMKRTAIRRLEDWVEAQHQREKEEANGDRNQGRDTRTGDYHGGRNDGDAR